MTPTTRYRAAGPTPAQLVTARITLSTTAPATGAPAGPVRSAAVRHALLGVSRT